MLHHRQKRGLEMVRPRGPFCENHDVLFQNCHFGSSNKPRWRDFWWFSTRKEVINTRMAENFCLLVTKSEFAQIALTRRKFGSHVHREAPSPSLEEGLPLLRACLVPYGIANGKEFGTGPTFLRPAGAKLPPQGRIMNDLPGPSFR